MENTENTPQVTKLEELSFLAKLAEINMETVEIVSQWLLITYDLPHTPEGDKARRNFLNQASLIGATQHTASVYYMPWSIEAECLAMDLAKIGKACVWTSKPAETLDCEKLTEQYDKNLEKLLDEMVETIGKIDKHFKRGHEKQVRRMALKAKQRLRKLFEAVKRRGSQSILIYAISIERRLSVYA